MPPLPSPSRARGLIRLAICCAVILTIWLGVLPLIGRLPGVQEYIAHNNAEGIDPSVRFYSELPAMPAIQERIDSAHRRAGAVFWNPRATVESLDADEDDR